MNISIKNFKAISNLQKFELKPLTVLSGVNSAGKSSLLQLLLLLKQTAEIDSAKEPLYITGYYYKAKSFIDLLGGKNPTSSLHIGFEFNKSELQEFGEAYQQSLFDGFDDYTCSIGFEYGCENNDPVIRKFHLLYKTEVKEEYLKIEHEPKEIFVHTNSSYLLKMHSSFAEYKKTNSTIILVRYSSFFPVAVECAIETVNENILDSTGYPTISLLREVIIPNTDSIKSYLNEFFRRMHYIGPLRIEPKDSYESKPNVSEVGIRGENTAQLLENLRDEMIKCSIPVADGERTIFEEKTISLLAATNFWICEVFKMGKQIYSKENSDSYTIFLRSHNDIESTIKHVGFGVSQVLPVIVQGLLTERGGTLILEQPEIHLHPKLQSGLFDFLHSLILQGKKIIIETHSDHFITRLRRRIAEDESSNLQNQIGLTFIEPRNGELTFTKIKLDDLGVYNVFPEDFIDSPEKELKAILSAQIKKRKSKRQPE
jgi:predicted ATPase